MILYNVTISIDEGVHEDWLQWMRTIHIPEVMATGCFSESRLLRVHGEEEGGLTYAISYLSPSQELLDRYQTDFAPGLQEAHSLRFSGHFAAFRTFLSLLEEYKA